MPALENIPAILVILAALAATVSVVYYTLRCGISPMPSSTKATRIMVETLADVEPGAKIIELGSGWGNVATAIARTCPQARVEGYERSPLPFLFSVLACRFSQPANPSFHRKDFMKADFGDADAVVCYLYPGGMSRLRGKLEQELRPGALVVSNTFAVPGWKPERTVRVGDVYGTRVYVYRR